MRYQINKGTKAYGASTIFQDIQFEIRNNEKIAVVGRNGCGKTTLLKIIAQEEELDSGSIHKENGIQIGYLAQTTFKDEEQSVRSEMERAFERVKQLEKELNAAAKQLEASADEKQLENYARIQEAFEEAGGYQWESRNDEYRYPFWLYQRRSAAQDQGIQRRTAYSFGICETALSKPDILLLDEPTNSSGY